MIYAVNETVKVASLDFLGRITPYFEYLLRQHKQRYRENITTAVLYNDESLLWSMFH